MIQGVWACEAIHVMWSDWEKFLGLAIWRGGWDPIDSVYLSWLGRASCCFALKIMDKASLALCNELLAFQTENEILVIGRSFCSNFVLNLRKYNCSKLSWYVIELIMLASGRLDMTTLDSFGNCNACSRKLWSCCHHLLPLLVLTPHVFLLVVRRVQGETSRSLQLVEDLPGTG
jgi:hypothetical protein